MPLPKFSDSSEDCLFLDVYVPAKALKNPSIKLPVVVYIYGGGYVLGSKDTYQPLLPFYDGSGLMGQSGNNMIFVTLNYRLGAFGWLAGTSMEKDGLPNAALWDQRAVFEWVRNYISLVGGDPGQVTAMGESAGAGSLVHHLVAQGGKLDPLFQKAILLSPAFEPMWDRGGIVENTFQNYATLAGCRDKGLACLRAADTATLIRANTALMDMQTPGSFAVGPAPDGKFIRQLPVLELATGNFWKIESMVLSHCAKESVLFVSGALSTNDHFSTFVNSIFPGYANTTGINTRVSAFYPPIGAASCPYKTQSDRVEAFIRDSSFTCNIRYLNEAVGDNKVYNMQYSVSPGWHGADLFAVFYNSKFTSNSWTEILASFVLLPLGVMYGGISWAMQSYLASYITTGDPNKNRVVLNVPPTIGWNHPNSANELVSGVVNVGNWFYSTVNDDQHPKSACDFWREFSAAVTAVGGYSPPGTAPVRQGIAVVKEDASRNYVGGNTS
jgi:carboxylesterase type B